MYKTVLEDYAYSGMRELYNAYVAYPQNTHKHKTTKVRNAHFRGFSGELRVHVLYEKYSSIVEI